MSTSGTEHDLVIGRVVALDGKAWAESPSGVRPLSKGSEVFQGEIVLTGDGSRLEIEFADKTILSQGEDARVELNDYVFDPQGSDSNLLFNMMTGTFRAVTGEIVKQNPERFNLTTPLATIGIRGTTIVATVNEQGESIGVQEIVSPENNLDEPLTGEPPKGYQVVVVDQFGNVRIISDSLFILDIDPATGASILRPFTPAEQQYYERLSPVRYPDLKPGQELTPGQLAEAMATPTIFFFVSEGLLDNQGASPWESGLATDFERDSGDAGQSFEGVSWILAGLPPELTIASDPLAVSGLLALPGELLAGTMYLAEVQENGDEDVLIELSQPSDTPVDDQAPVAANDSAETDENTPVVIPVLANDSDPDGDPLSIDSVTQPANGSVTINPDGTLTYTPDEGYTGTDSFTYTVTDGDLTDTATVTVTVNEVNEAPVAANDSATTEEDTPVTIDVLANDADPNADDTLSVTSVGSPANGTASINPDGTITYTPNAGFFGTDSFTYTVSDGELTDTATVTVTVNEVNEAPVAANDSAETDENTPIVIPVLANDSDPDGDPLSIDSVTQPANGSVTIDPDGTITYTPDEGYTGTDSFTYTVSDGQGGTATATVTVTVTAVNQDPVANNDTATTTQNTAVTIPVLANDSDPDGDPLSIDSVTQPANGTVTIDPDGTITYTPDEGYTGTDSFTYTVSDGQGGTATATVMVTVTPDNDAPVAVADSATTAEDTPVTIDVLSNDSDPDGDTLSIESVTPPTNGTAEIIEGQVRYTPNADWSGTDSFTYTVTDGQGGTATATVTVTVTPANDPPVAVDDTVTTDEDTAATIDVLANDSDPENDPLTITAVGQASHGTAVISGNQIVYTPDANFNGTDTFTYTVSDGELTDTATVTVNVDPVNDVPVVSGPVDLGSMDEDGSLLISEAELLANASDIDGDSLSVTDLTVASGSGELTDNLDGTWTFIPTTDWNGEVSFDYSVTDGTTGTPAIASLTVDPVNDAPVASGSSFSTDEGQPLSGTLAGLASDVDGDTLTFSGSGATAEGGSVTINEDGSFTYTPALDFTGTDSFTYTVSDGELTDTATVTISVGEVNDPPVAVDDTVTTDEDTAVTIDVLANDSDPENDPLTITAVGLASHGTAVISGNQILYTPDANFNGTDTFTYTVSDGELTDTATVTVNVDPVNDVPVVSGPVDLGSMDEDGSLLISEAELLANASDIDGDPSLSVTDLTVASGSGELQRPTTGRRDLVLYIPTTDWNGEVEWGGQLLLLGHGRHDRHSSHGQPDRERGKRRAHRHYALQHHHRPIPGHECDGGYAHRGRSGHIRHPHFCAGPRRWRHPQHPLHHHRQRAPGGGRRFLSGRDLLRAGASR
jgi:CshA-type fibril repeat protein/VCBS repeat-containing protein